MSVSGSGLGLSKLGVSEVTDGDGVDLPRTCLIVEDSAITADFYQRILAEGGIRASVTDSLEASLHLLGGGARFDLILLDLMLPGVNGFDLLDRIREINREVTILVVSGKADAAAPTEAFFRGADGFAHKRELYNCEWACLRHIIVLAHAHRARWNAQEGARVTLEAKRRLVEAIFEFAPEGIVVAEAPDCRIRHVSAYAADLVGLPLSQLVDLPAEQHVERWSIWNADGVTRPSADDLPLTRAVKRGERVVNEEYMLENSDGRKIPVMVNAGPIYGAEGNVVAGVCAWREMGSIIRMREELERLVRNRTRDLSEAQHRLERLDAMKSKFLANVSHEFRTPLNVILGFTELLLESPPGELSVEQEQHLTNVLDAGRTLLRLVEDLLQLTWLDSAVEREEVAWFSPADVARGVVGLFERRLQASDVALVLKLDDESRVWGNSHLFEQMVYHLVDNAVKFTHEGHVEVAVTPLDDNLLMTVLDTGEGMPPEQVRQLFTPFEQDDDLVPGLGIGLYLCRRISERFGARLDIDSAVGVGTVVSLRLPLAARRGKPGGPVQS